MSAPMTMAHALSLFAPPADRDVANELDLLDMLSPNEQPVQNCFGICFKAYCAIYEGF